MASERRTAPRRAGHSPRGLRARDLGRGPSFLMFAGVIPVIPFVAVGQLIAVDLVGLQMYAMELAVMPVHGPHNSEGLTGGDVAAMVDAFHVLAAAVIGADLIGRWFRGGPERGPATACSALGLLVVGLSFSGICDAREDWDARQLRRIQAPALIERADRALESGDELEAVSLLEQALRDDHRLLVHRLRLGWVLLTSDDPTVRDVERAIAQYSIFERAAVYHERAIRTELDSVKYWTLKAVWTARAGDIRDADESGSLALSWSRDLLPEVGFTVREVLKRERRELTRRLSARPRND